MYTDTIFQDLGRIGELQFSSNTISDEIHLDVSEPTQIFFKHILPCKFGFSNPYPRYFNFGITKNRLNSIGNQIHPEFIKKLKKMLACALNDIKKGWEEIKINEKIEKNNDVIRIAKPRGIWYEEPHGVSKHIWHLWNMRDMYNLRDKLDIQKMDDVRIEDCKKSIIKIVGNSNDVFQFMSILQQESNRAALATIYDFPVTRLFMCLKNDKDWMANSRLPKELIKTIIKITYFLLVDSLDMYTYSKVESDESYVSKNRSTQDPSCNLF